MGPCGRRAGPVGGRGARAMEGEVLVRRKGAWLWRRRYLVIEAQHRSMSLYGSRPPTEAEELQGRAHVPAEEIVAFSQMTTVDYRRDKPHGRRIDIEYRRGSEAAGLAMRASSSAEARRWTKAILDALDAADSQRVQNRRASAIGVPLRKSISTYTRSSSAKPVAASAPRPSGRSSLGRVHFADAASAPRVSVSIDVQVESVGPQRRSKKIHRRSGSSPNPGFGPPLTRIQSSEPFEADDLIEEESPHTSCEFAEEPVSRRGARRRSQRIIVSPFKQAAWDRIQVAEQVYGTVHTVEQRSDFVTLRDHLVTALTGLGSGNETQSTHWLRLSQDVPPSESPEEFELVVSLPSPTEVAEDLDLSDTMQRFCDHYDLILSHLAPLHAKRSTQGRTTIVSCRGTSLLEALTTQSVFNGKGDALLFCTVLLQRRVLSSSGTSTFDPLNVYHYSEVQPTLWTEPMMVIVRSPAFKAFFATIVDDATLLRYLCSALASPTRDTATAERWARGSAVDGIQAKTMLKQDLKKVLLDVLHGPVLRSLLTHVFSMHSQEAHGLALDMYWYLLKNHIAADHYCLLSLHCSVCKEVDSQFTSFVETLSEPRFAHIHMIESLFGLLIDESWCRIKPVVHFKTRVVRPGLWKCLFLLINHAPDAVFVATLKDISALVVESTSNALAILAQPEWQSWIAPFVVSNTEKEVVHRVLYILTRIHQHSFFSQTEFDVLLFPTLGFFAVAQPSLDLLYAFLLRFVNGLKSSPRPPSFTRSTGTVGCQNLVRVCRLVLKCVFCSYGIQQWAHQGKLGRQSGASSYGVRHDHVSTAIGILQGLHVLLALLEEDKSQEQLTIVNNAIAVLRCWSPVGRETSARAAKRFFQYRKRDKFVQQELELVLSELRRQPRFT